jgi:hypothetical protein
MILAPLALPRCRTCPGMWLKTRSVWRAPISSATSVEFCSAPRKTSGPRKCLIRQENRAEFPCQARKTR